jgi:hypothetical protein
MKAFAGVATYARKIHPRKVTKAGVWLNEETTPEQQHMIREKTEKATKGKIAIREYDKGVMTVTTIAFVGRLSDTKAARATATTIAKIVEEVTGIRSALVELPDYHAVTTALHCT